MYLEKNIELLMNYDPELASKISNTKRSKNIRIQNTKINLPSLRIGNITLHSLYDPIKEAREWIIHYKDKIKEASQLIVFGMGLGYHLIELCNETGSDIIVFEPRIDVLRTAFEIMDLSSLIRMVRFITDIKIPELNKNFIILEHSPSVNMNPEYFRIIHSKLKVLKSFQNGLRILVVGPIYGGSLPIARYCVNALRNLGHKVDFVDNSIYKDIFLGIDKLTNNQTHQNQLKTMFSEFVSEAVIAKCAEFNPHLILALAQAPLCVGSLKKLQDNKIPTAFWFVEDFRLRGYWKDVAPFYDFFFTIQKTEFIEELRKIGVKHPYYLPLAASPDIHKKMELPEHEKNIYKSDISFVGAGYYNRRRFFEGLLDFDFKIWGNEWDLNSPLCRYIQRSGERIETEEIVKIFNSTKININLHSSAYHEGINPNGDFLNPRTFEIAACGAFQLVDYRSELAEFFRIDEEIVCFYNLDDLRKKIRHYLVNHEERIKIATLSRKRVLSEHTYELRMREMFNFLLNNGYEVPQWDSGKIDLESLIGDAGENTELGKYLKQFDGVKCVDLKDIVNKINRGNGSLSKIEKIFLLMYGMKEFHTPKI